MHDPTGENEWSQIVPQGTTWAGFVPEVSSAGVGISSGKEKIVRAKKVMVPVQESSANIYVAAGTAHAKHKRAAAADKAKPDKPKEFKGDRVLARSIAFMRDAMWSWECAYAVAEGDAG